METGKKIVTAGTFGAALVAMGIAPELDAAIVNLSFTPGSLPYNGGPGTTLVPVNINEIAGSIDFSQWNDYVGRTMLLGGGGYMQSFGTVQYSQTLIASQPNWNYGFPFGNQTSGTAFIGFHTVGGNVGWFPTGIHLQHQQPSEGCDDQWGP